MPRDDDSDRETKDGGEGKGESKEEAGEGVDEVSQIVLDFCEYGTGERMTAIKQEFFDEHCAGFEEAEALEQSGRGHPLEWTTLHNKFLEIFDAELSRFCVERGVSEKELTVALEEITDKRRAHLHFTLPVFLLTTEYEYFVTNMCSTAKVKKMMRDVERGGDDARSIAGLYTWQPPSKKAHEKWLKLRGAPWTLRKIVLNASRKTEVVITHTPYKHYSSAFAVPMFGRAEFAFALDGERTPYVWGKDPNPHFFYTASQPDETKIAIKVEGEKHRKDTKEFYKIDTIEKTTGGDLIHLQRWLRFSDGAEVGRIEADLLAKKGK